MKTVKLVYFVHGTTTDNLTDIATGWAPGKLSELGIKQSKELKDHIKKQGFKFDVVFTSDLKRAVDSAKLTHSGETIKIIRDKRLRECNYGDWTRKSADWKITEFIDKKYPNGESYKDVEKRIREFLKYLLDNYSDKTVGIVAHQAPQLAIEVIINGKSWKQAIEEDWRPKKEWKPGWVYELTEKIKL